MTAKKESRLQSLAERMDNVITPEIWEQALREQEEKGRQCIEAAHALVSGESDNATE